MTIVVGGIQLTMSISLVNRAVDPDMAERELQWQSVLSDMEWRRLRAMQQLAGGDFEQRRWWR